MTRVDFYILNDPSTAASERYACRLAEKAIHARLCVFMRTITPEAATQLDTLLWTFRQGSFVPHRLSTQPNHSTLPAPVVIGVNCIPADIQGLCINLAGSIPPDSGNWQRIAEIVSGTDADKAAARDRFRHYRELGCELHTHNVTG